MIKLCLDENINPHLAGALKPVFRRLSFTSVHQLNLTGLEDEALFVALAGAKIGGLITLDQMQLVNENERFGLRKANLHWIGLPMPDAKGYKQQALIASSLIAGLRTVIDRGFGEVPHMYMLPSSPNPGPGLVSARAL